MTIEDAIKHCEDVANHCNNEQCSLDHMQLKEWLVELVERRKQPTKKKVEKMNVLIDCIIIIVISMVLSLILHGNANGCTDLIVYILLVDYCKRQRKEE